MTPGRATFHIDELDCAEEVLQLRRQLDGYRGIGRLDFDVLHAHLTVEYDADAISPAGIRERIAALGMQASLWHPRDTAGARDDGRRRFRSLSVTLSGAACCAGCLVHAWWAGSVMAALGQAGESSPADLPWPAQGCYVVSILIGLWFVVPRAWSSLRRLRTDMHVLMCVAVAGAVAIGQWLEAATVTFLFALALLLEHWSMAHARRVIGALLSLTPPTARCLPAASAPAEVGEVREGEVPAEPVGADGSAGASPSQRWIEKPAEDVSVGEVVVVRPGEKFPLDGTVLCGSSSVNQAPLTGESVPVSKQPGDGVFAGTINGEGAIEFTVTRPADDTTLARIVHLVRDAQARRAASEQWVERFAEYYTPGMVVLAIAVAVLPPPLLLAAAWTDWFYNGLVILVIACPCALVISTPVSIVAALTAAVRHGVLVKGGRYLEVAANLQAVALDKTGTLTSGQPEVCTVLPLSGHSAATLLRRAATLESHSTHPIARALLRHAEQAGLAPEPTTAYRVFDGLGAEALLEGQTYWIGGSRLLQDRLPEAAAVAEQVRELSRAGQTVVVLGNQRQVCGLIGLADRVRSEVRSALDDLRRLGLRRIVMLTGDNPETARGIAAAAGVDEYHAELLPEEKLREIESLRSRFGLVAMIGDGVNDAPAMAAASLGIAMGAIGSDAAIETADIALMADDLSQLPWLIRLARRTVSTVRRNVAFALGLKAVFVILTLSGAGSLWLAIAADMGASLLVIFYGLRLLRT